MKFFSFIIIILFSFATTWAAQSPNYAINEYIINSGGNTTSANAIKQFGSIGESIVGQIYGQTQSIQTGFFNRYFNAPPTPTITATPIRSFGGELLDQKWVYAAPNPIRGHVAHIHYHLAQAAEVEINVFTTSNQLVISKHWGSMPVGQNNWDWNVSNLANGVYIMLVKAKNDNRTTVVKKKIALIK